MWITRTSAVARLVLAAVLLASGVLKVIDPAQTVVAVRAYRLLPEELVRIVAVTLPFMEIALAAFLLLGLAVRATAIVSVVLFAGLIGAIASVWARGLSIDCGCFGGGGDAADVTWTDYATEIARDLGFVALGCWLAVFPTSPWALGVRSRRRTMAPARDVVMAE
ncbi:DoxX family membrane protein [Rhodococcus rhodnii]|uniref:Methylamine utilisation protein MauE domain-containing protein n=2 Tax=Rhodococcus rhodnii TaxID=38312 RepID=R7WQ08_9NOCA|nr:MauE/DoxX family redox-associated membrane protein [Rhodococcus rhodnii]EOM77406.1 hypothetical protein Rrhod_1212 [Rhodococcus rhodnii LMG 5362]TXG90637.1 DoxX family membrane protein [Rhodococcus rhodnii]